MWKLRIWPRDSALFEGVEQASAVFVLVELTFALGDDLVAVFFLLLELVESGLDLGGFL